MISVVSREQGCSSKISSTLRYLLEICSRCLMALCLVSGLCRGKFASKNVDVIQANDGKYSGAAQGIRSTATRANVFENLYSLNAQVSLYSREK